MLHKKRVDRGFAIVHIRGIAARRQKDTDLRQGKKSMTGMAYRQWCLIT